MKITIKIPVRFLFLDLFFPGHFAGTARTKIKSPGLFFIFNIHQTVMRAHENSWFAQKALQGYNYGPFIIKRWRSRAGFVPRVSICFRRGPWTSVCWAWWWVRKINLNEWETQKKYRSDDQLGWVWSNFGPILDKTGWWRWILIEAS